jgi:hypothetical protein
LLKVIDKDPANFLQGGAWTTLVVHNCWNEVLSVSMIQQGMKELGASITFLKEIAFDLLAEKLFLCKLQLRKLRSEKLFLVQ